MKGYYRHILAATAVLLTTAACNKNEPDGPQQVNAPIAISATEAGVTKALLDNGSFNTTGNRIQVYSYANGSYYFSDMIGPDVQGSPAAAANDDVWPFVNGPHNWTSGNHRFYGWLTKDANSNLGPENLFGNTFNCVTANKNVYVAAFNTDTQTLTIPTTTMSPATPQFDFMYSDIFTTEPINAPVQLKFSHLFCAVSFGIVNDASSDVRISNFNVTLCTNKKATVDYSGSTVAVNYTNTASSPATFRTSSGGTLSGMSDGISAMWANAFAPADTERQYILMWPQTKAELSACKINITYTLNSQRYEQSLVFPEMELNAGQKYHFDIFIADKAPIRINYLVVDWDSIENDVTFE
jgi:hypothetical protein